MNPARFIYLHSPKTNINTGHMQSARLVYLHSLQTNTSPGHRILMHLYLLKTSLVQTKLVRPAAPAAPAAIVGHLRCVRISLTCGERKVCNGEILVKPWV
jgi:hypothetical protein